MGASHSSTVVEDVIDQQEPKAEEHFSCHMPVADFSRWPLLIDNTYLHKLDNMYQQ